MRYWITFDAEFLKNRGAMRTMYISSTANLSGAGSLTTELIYKVGHPDCRQGALFQLILMILCTCLFMIVIFLAGLEVRCDTNVSYA